MQQHEDGRPIVLKLDQRKIHRVKYYPAKYVHKTDDRGKDEVTEEVYERALGKDCWRMARQLCLCRKSW